MKYVIGIDVGSGSARAGIFSLNGEEKGFSSTNIKIKKYEEIFSLVHSKFHYWDVL